MTRRAQLVASLVLPTLHLLWCLAIEAHVVESEGSWTWFFVFLVDLPVSAIPLILGSSLDVPPVISFGVLGTAWWYFVSRVLIYVAMNAFSKSKA